MIGALVLAAALAATPPPTGDWNLIYNDTFDGTTLSPDWQTRGTDYTARATHAKADPSATTLSNGVAHLRVIPDPDNPGNYLTGHIGTEAALSFTYGYAEARIKFHRFRGSHGAFWLLTPGSIPEIDVAEYFGARRPWRGNGTIWANYFWGSVITPDGIKRPTTTDDFGLDEAWSRHAHDYGVLWEPDGFTFYIDGVEVHSVSAIDVAPKFLVLSLLTKDFEFDELRTDRLDDYDMRVLSVNVWQRRAL